VIARIRRPDGKRQSISEHSRSTARLARRFLEQAGLGHTAGLTALLHDMGKSTQAFFDYLLYAVEHPDEKKSGPPHAPAGAIFAYERWFHGDPWQKRAAQLISMAIGAHHAGLPDCLDPGGASKYLSALSQQRKDEIHYGEAVQNFLREVAGAEELDGLFAMACGEVRSFLELPDGPAKPFQAGMLARLLLSALVDADRWDSACFERDASPDARGEAPDWGGLLARLEAYMKDKFRGESPIDGIRAQISDACGAGAENPRGIFTLTVPTGGGKTLSSLRFQLAHAAHTGGMRRAFYIIPYNTILDQNADEIRKALGGYPILEHHSGVAQDSEEEFAAHRRLTERWDSGIILTSMVQFLNALFRAENTDARRMHALCHSILIFDEIQALPKYCTRLFEEAVRFLVEKCGCTALILTATQPRLDFQRRELISDVPALFQKLRRVRYVDESRDGRDGGRAAEDLSSLVGLHGSVLAVVNTKPVAQALFHAVRSRAEPGVACAHLSTLMCPAHRMDVLNRVKARLAAEERVFLISTQLIEAGINVSFPAVVRSLAGLPSVIQAGGRCNRNAETPLGTVYIWRLVEESLKALPEIRRGQDISGSILDHLAAHPGEIGDPVVIDRYFEKERAECGAELSYPYQDGSWQSNLVDMLSRNQGCAQAARERVDEPLKRLALRQSFRTAGEAFRVIDAPTRAILVPYGEGAEIILDLAGEHSMQEEIHLLRRAQRFSVGVYEHAFRRLMAQRALISVAETGALALKPEFYDGETGVLLEPGEMEFLEISDRR